MQTKDLLQIKNQLQMKQSERDKLLGKKESLLDQLKKYGFKNLIAAENALEKLEMEIEVREQDLTEKVSDFKDKFGELL